jgi:membrane protein YqaA with SNARE-associated domain
LPEARLIKNPAAKALNTVLASVGVGAVVGGVSGLLTPMFMNKKTELWLAFGSTVGATVGAGIGLLLGYGVFGRVAEQQQETENKVHLAKTRVLVEQVTPLSLDTVPME